MAIIERMTLPSSARQMRGSNHSGMRQYNERIVLQAIRHHGAIPKADLARLTQLSSQTVAIIVGRLEAEGLLLKQDKVRGRIGQPSVPLSLNPDGAFSLGIQVGRRSMELLIADFCGQTVLRHETHYDYPDPDALLEAMQSGMAELQQQMGSRWARVVGVGLTAPLFLHQWADLLGGGAANSLARWDGIDFRQRVQALTHLPVVFAKDTMAACVAELLQGHGRQRRSFLYVFIGTFIGGALVLGGQLIGGEHGNAGAIGSLPVGLAQADQAPPQLLQMASGWQLEQALQTQGLDPLLVQRDEVMQSRYSALTSAWIAQASQALAMTVASSSALLDLDAVVLDGSLSPALMAALCTHTQASLAHYRFEGMHQPALLMGQVGSHARALGGALLPLHEQFFPDTNIILKQDASTPL